MVLLNKSTRGIRNLLTGNREISRLLLDFLLLEHFKTRTAPHLLCIFGTQEDNHNQSALRKLVTLSKKAELSLLREESGQIGTSSANRINMIFRTVKKHM